MMQSTVLGRLFGSEARVRLLRLFLMNPNEVFDSKIIAKRAQLRPAAFTKDLQMLIDIGYIKRSMRVVTIAQTRGGKLKRRKINGFVLVRDFPYINEIAVLLASDAPRAREKLLSSVKNAGKVNLLVISGRLVNDETRVVDVFIVGDSLKKARIERALKSLEGETGKELVYALMPTQEFQYRYGLFDKFFKELFDNPHEIILNKLGIG